MDGYTKMVEWRDGQPGCAGVQCKKELKVGARVCRGLEGSLDAGLLFCSIECRFGRQKAREGHQQREWVVEIVDDRAMRAKIRLHDDGFSPNVLLADVYDTAVFDADKNDLQRNSQTIAKAPKMLAILKRLEAEYGSTRDERPDCLDLSMVKMVDEIREILCAIDGKKSTKKGKAVRA